MFKVSSANSMENLDAECEVPEIKAEAEPESEASSAGYMYQRQALCELSPAPSHLEHNCSLDIDHESRFVRQTNLIATIGPSCDSKETIRKMILNGMNIARLNLTLGGYEYHAGVVKKLREVENELNMKPLVAIAVDITTPTIRTGFIHGKPNGKVDLASGSFMEITTNDDYREASSAEVVWIDRSYFPSVLHAIKIGDRIFIDDGAISVIVRERTADDRLKCLVEQGGPLSSSVRLGLPRKTLYKHFVAEKYRQDLLFAVENEVDMVFASYIESGDEVLRVKRVLNQMNPDVKLIARIETAQAVYNIDGILSVADGVLIARGDLGLELPPQKVFLAQKTIIARGNRAQVPVIVATQMLESMRFKPRPTRAEVSDVANAILDGADALVVTVETAKGNYPVETMQFLHRISREAESAIFHNQLIDLKRAQSRHASAMPSRPMSVGGSPRGSSASLLPPSHFAAPLLQASGGFQMAAMYSNLNLNPDGSEADDHTSTTALSAVEAAFKCCASAILVVTTSGRSANQLSAFRPACPIVAIVRSAQVGRQCHLHRSIHPVLYTGAKREDWAEDMDRRIHFGISYGQERGFLSPRDNVIVVTGSRAGSGSTNTVRIITVPDDNQQAPLRIVRSQQSFQPYDD